MKTADRIKGAIQVKSSWFLFCICFVVLLGVFGWCLFGVFLGCFFFWFGVLCVGFWGVVGGLFVCFFNFSFVYLFFSNHVAVPTAWGSSHQLNLTDKKKKTHKRKTTKAVNRKDLEFEKPRKQQEIVFGSQKPEGQLRITHLLKVHIPIHVKSGLDSS